MVYGRRVSYKTTATVTAALMAVVMLLAAPAWAQGQTGQQLGNQQGSSSGSLVGKTVVPGTSGGDNAVDTATIDAAGCNVATDATITVRDGDGTTARFENGNGIRITADDNRITIIGTLNGGDIDLQEEQGGDDDQLGANPTITEATSVTCSGGGNDATSDQYADQNNTEDTNQREETTLDTAPDKPLPPTGGLPSYGVIAGSILVGVGLLSLGLGLRR